MRMKGEDLQKALDKFPFYMQDCPNNVSKYWCEHVNDGVRYCCPEKVQCDWLKELKELFSAFKAANLIIPKKDTYKLCVSCFVGCVAPSKCAAKKLLEASKSSDQLSPEEIRDVEASEKEIATGNCKVFENAEDFIADLHGKRKASKEAAQK